MKILSVQQGFGSRAGRSSNTPWFTFLSIFLFIFSFYGIGTGRWEATLSVIRRLLNLIVSACRHGVLELLALHMRVSSYLVLAVSNMFVFHSGTKPTTLFSPLGFGFPSILYCQGSWMPSFRCLASGAVEKVSGITSRYLLYLDTYKFSSFAHYCIHATRVYRSHNFYIISLV